MQQGGPYAITKSVIAGGGNSSTNGTTAVVGTTAQSLLGVSTRQNFSLNAGFWQNQPAGTLEISGNVSYCVSPAAPAVPNVVMNLTGAVSSSTTVDASGHYQFSAIPVGNTYTVTPSKSGAVSGINAQDIGRIRRFVALLDTPTACQTIASNVDNTNPAVNAQDAGVLRRYVALLPDTGDAGTWKFNPTSQTFNSAVSNQIANFDGVLVGDVDGSWTPASPGGLKSSPQLPATTLTVSFPNVSANQGVTVFVPVTITGALAASDNMLGYTLDLTFDQNIATFVPDPGQSYSTVGTISAAGTVTENKELSPNRLRLVVDFNNPLIFSGSQTLIYIKFKVIGAPGQMTNLTWNPGFPPEFGNGPPAIVTTSINGSLSVNSPSAVSLYSFAATSYQSGVCLQWETGLEVDNLGFNVYREVAGQRELVNPEIVAGSALLTGNTRLQTGRKYAWWDKTANKQPAQYWLEDVELNGTRVIHGPFGVQTSAGNPPAGSFAETLSQIGKTAAQSRPVQSIRRLGSSENQVQKQQELARGPAIKLRIRDEGWYVVKRQELIAAGLDSNADPRKLQLYVHGQEVPILVIGQQEKSFDAIEFYATGEDNPFTDTHVYWLAIGPSQGSRITQVKGDGLNQTDTSFPFTVERKDRTIYFSGLLNGEKENFFGALIGQAPVDQVLTLSHVESHSNVAARLEVRLQGVTLVSHRVRINLNGNYLGDVAFDYQTEGTVTLDVAHSLLREGSNIVNLVTSSPSDLSLVGSLRLTYQHSFTADHNLLRFAAPGNQKVRIEGFNVAKIRVIDITAPDAPQEVEGEVEEDKSGFSVTVTSPNMGSREFLAFTEEEVKAPVSLDMNRSSSWRQAGQAADLLIISRRDFFASAERLSLLRQKEGYKVVVVDVEDVYDEFNYGERNPNALRDFVSYARENWKIGPRFLLLIGDASFDSRNYLGAGDFDLVPTKLVDTEFMETASDDWLVDANGDGLADIAVGRLPARTALEADRMVSKILGYGSLTASETALLVADTNDAYDFENATAQLRGLLPSTLRVEEIYRGRLDAATAKARLLEGINRGERVVNYTGHGNVTLWRGNLLTTGDADVLADAERPTLFVLMTCLNGYFQDPILEGLAESLMKVERGGAVAVWASSGLTRPTDQSLMNRELYGLLFGASGGAQPRTLGEAVLRAKSAVRDADVRSTWILFGDPTMRLR